MSESLPVLEARIDVKLGGVLLANMLSDRLDDNRHSSFSVKAVNEFHDQRAAPEQDRLCLCAPVDAGESPSP